MQILSFIFASYIGFFVIVEIIKRKTRVDTEITRKIVHVVAGALTIYWSSIITKEQFLAITGIFLGIFIITYKFRVFKSLYAVNRKTYGDLAFICGLLFLGIFFYSERSIFVHGILLLIFPDAIAGLTSFFLKKERKTFIHAVAYFLTTLVISSLYVTFPQVLLFVIILTSIEYYSPYGLDNITVPASFILMTLLFL